MTTLAEASGWGGGREIRLTADIVVGSLSVPTGATVTIDLDGYTLLVASAAPETAVHVQPESTLTLTGDGTLDARGRILIDGVFDNRSLVTASGPILVAGVVIDSGSLTPPVTAAPSSAADVTTALTRLTFHPNLAGLDDDTIRLSAARQLSASGTTPIASVLPTSVQDAARSGFTFARAGHSLTWATSPGVPAEDRAAAGASGNGNGNGSGSGSGSGSASTAVDDNAGLVWDAAAALGPDQDLFAQWTVHRHTVSFDSAGGSAVAPLTTDYGKTIGMPTDPVRAGFTFGGWMLADVTDGSSTRWNPSTAITADVTLYASWSPLPAQPLADGIAAPATDLLAVDRTGQRTWGSGSAGESDTASDEAAAVTEAQASAAGSMPWMWIGLVVAGVVGMTMIPRGNDN
jgi:uncharacterized repeat protein (TIGR02543 family)